MKMFNSKGMIKVPETKKTKKVRKTEPVITQECYCPNGHNLVSSRVQFKKLNGISLKVKSGKKSGVIFLSPICGDTSNMSLDIDLKKDEMLDIHCPECDIKLPVYSPCSCGGSLITLFGDKNLNYENCIGVCNKVGCKNAVIITGNELRKCSMPFL